MDLKRLEQLSVIKDELLTNPNIDVNLIWDACKLAEEDNYLYDLMVDWMKETNDHIKSELLNEIVNYSEEVFKKAGSSAIN